MIGRWQVRVVKAWTLRALEGSLAPRGPDDEVLGLVGSRAPARGPDESDRCCHSQRQQQPVHSFTRSPAVALSSEERERGEERAATRAADRLYLYMCYDHRVCEVHGSVPNLTQELNSKNGFIEAHGLTEEPTERPKSS